MIFGVQRKDLQTRECVCLRDDGRSAEIADDGLGTEVVFHGEKRSRQREACGGVGHAEERHFRAGGGPATVVAVGGLRGHVVHCEAADADAEIAHAVV